MKQILTIILCLLTTTAIAQTPDSLYINSLTTSIDSLKVETESLRTKNNLLDREVSSLKAKINLITKQLEKTQGDINTQANKSIALEKGINATATNLQNTATILNNKIDTTDNNVAAQSQSLNNATLWGAIIAFIVLAFSALISVLLHKKGNDKIEKLKEQAEKLNEKIVSQFTTEVSELQKISASLSGLASSSASSDVDHDLIKTLADRITFMEMTLYKMDKSIRGHKHLTKTLSQMKDNLLASGYEIVDMLGKSYHPGMKVTANFIDDDSLEEGAQIITSIIKPQINYRGQAIQTAQITVSQNI